MSRIPDNALLKALAAATAAQPYARKLLVCRRAGIGRELLRALASRGVSWIGWEITTPSRLAHELAAPLLATQGLGLADEFDELALVDAALDAVLRAEEGGLAALADRVGLRQAVASSVSALRLGGVSADALRRVRLRDTLKASQIVALLEHYEGALAARKLVDGAGLFEHAVTAARTAGDSVWLMQDLTRRGVQGTFLDALLEGGAQVLEDEPVFGLERPRSLLPPPAASDAPAQLSWLHAPAQAVVDERVTVDVFAAATTVTELREVMRRVIAAELRWDEVEIIAADAVDYGVALDGIARELSIPVSHAAGLPLARTRTGRAVHQFLAWIEGGFESVVLRGMLERGDVASKDDAVSGMALARRLRALRIGRGGDRYGDVIERRIAALPDDSERAEELAQLRELLALTTDVLSAVPDMRAPVTAGAFAEAVLGMLRRVPVGSAHEAIARERVTAHLSRLRATARREVAVDAALALVRRVLDQRVPPPSAQGPAPWRASGGHLHLSDIETGGYTGRRATFVVGLDAARFPGSGGMDPLLVDDDRERVNAAVPHARMSTAQERIAERRHALAQLLARLRGSVTLSYATWDAVDGRTIAPSAELLQAHRLRTGDGAADYNALREATVPVAGAVPHGVLLDEQDAWLHAVAAEGAPRRGVKLVCALYQNLGAGAEVVKAWRAGAPAGAVHGVIAPRPLHDPRRSGARVSATQLQVLGACPHRYLLRHVLQVKPPQDEQVAADQWLSAADRGSLLHAVYERTMRAVIDGVMDVHDVALEAHALAVLRQLAEQWRVAVSAPGERVYQLEHDALAADVRAFVAMMRADDAHILALEHRFGVEGTEPVEVELPDGSVIHVTGAIDRIDEVGDGLVIVDYKTGSAYRFGEKHGVFDGGRRLQHALYAAVAEKSLRREVLRADYLFPTQRSANRRVSFTREQLSGGLDTLLRMLELAGCGGFVPTTDAEDCRYCDYRASCRVRDGDYGKLQSAPAEWSRSADNSAVDVLRGLRR